MRFRIGAEESRRAEPEQTSPDERGCSRSEHLIRIYQTLARLAQLVSRNSDVERGGVLASINCGLAAFMRRARDRKGAYPYRSPADCASAARVSGVGVRPDDPVFLSSASDCWIVLNVHQGSDTWRVKSGVWRVERRVRKRILHIEVAAQRGRRLRRLQRHLQISVEYT